MVEFHFLNIVLALQINGGNIFLRSDFKLNHHFGVIAKTNFFGILMCESLQVNPASVCKS